MPAPTLSDGEPDDVSTPTQGDPKDWAGQLGDRVRERRDALKLTQQTVAERAGTTTGAISQIEGGKRNPSVKTLLRLASTLECTPGYLLDGLPVPPADTEAGDAADS